MVNLVGRTTEDVVDLVSPHVDRPYRARQVAAWVVGREASSFAEMTDLPKDLRRELELRFEVAEPTVLTRTPSADGATKYLFRFADGVTVEGVAMPEGDKLTLCLSSQAGCAVGCTFCVTGALGAGRNLTAAEIVGQYRIMRRLTRPAPERVNLVFMGMGEPLLNTKALGDALDVLFERVSPKRVTVSTSGVIPGIGWLAERERRPKLALSLNAPDQERRVQIMPIAARYPLGELLDAIRGFPLERGRRVTFEYVLIRGFNDSSGDARQVARLIHGVPAKVNVIPLNEDPIHFPALERPEAAAVDEFARTLRDAGLTVTVRWSKGTDVAAACGQLKGRHQRHSR